MFPEVDCDSREPKLTVSRGTSLKVICYIHVAGSFEAGNSLNLTVAVIVSQHSQADQVRVHSSLGL